MHAFLGVVVLDWLEVWVLHGVAGRDSLSVVVFEHLSEQVEGLFSHELVILGANELGPRLAWLGAEDVVVVAVESHIVFLHVHLEFVSAKDL